MKIGQVGCVVASSVTKMFAFARIFMRAIALSFAVCVSGAAATKEFGASTILFDGAFTGWRGFVLFVLFVCVIIVRTRDIDLLQVLVHARDTLSILYSQPDEAILTPV